jgi:hypothetical protein
MAANRSSDGELQRLDGERESQRIYDKHRIHWQFEGIYVGANIKAAEVKPLVTPLHEIDDEWNDYMAYLRQSGTLVERVYELDKRKGFEGAGTPEAKRFTDERLAAGASMLRDLIYAAWVKSAEPVPESK